MSTTHHPFDSRWEYKTVRARNGEFGQREHLRALLEQEARAGWVLVEKYSNTQVRFRRSRSAHLWDNTLPPEIDPYRTIYSPAQDDQALYFLLLTVSVIVVILMMAVLGVLVSLPT